MGFTDKIKKAANVGVKTLSGGMIDPRKQLSMLKDLSGGGGGQPRPPGYSGPQFDMRNTNEFIKNDAAPQLGALPGGGSVERRFSKLKQEASQGANTAQQQASDAIKRRFSALGSGGGGAQIKLEQQALSEGEQNKNKAMRDIEDQEQSALELRQDKEAQRQVQQADIDFRQKVFNFESGSKLHELNLAERQQQIGQAENQYSARLNQFLNQPPKQGLISKVLGGIL